ncbi:MAG: hypothetical protein ABEI97_00745, partial [Candidatus Nanohaloarchaea archaeon]
LSPPLPVIAAAAGGAAVLLVHLAAGAYQVYVGERRRGLLSLAGVAAVVVGAVLIAAAGLGVNAGGGLLGTGTAWPVLSTAVFVINGVMLVAGIITARFFAGHGWATAGFPLIFILVFSVLFWQHLSTVNAAVNGVRSPDLDTPRFDAYMASDRFSSTVGRAGDLGPPLSAAAQRAAVVSYAAAEYTFWNQIHERYGGEHRLTGPGSVCAGTVQNAEERFEHQPGRLAAFILEHQVLDRTVSDRDTVVRAINASCRASDECTLDEINPASDYGSLSVALRERVTRVREMVGVDPGASTDIAVAPDCTGLPSRYYRVNVTAVSCSNGVSAQLQNLGTRPISGDVDIHVFRRGNTSLPANTSVAWQQPDLAATAENVTSLPGWVSGVRTIDAGRQEFSGVVGGAFRFRDGEPYLVQLSFRDPGFTAALYCRGGDGFCTDCG